MILYVNLLNFTDSRIGGVGYFIKRIFEGLNKNPEDLAFLEEVVIFSSIKINVEDIFGLPPCRNIEIIRVPIIHKNFVLRILYEQFILPFRMYRNGSIFFTPSPVAPLLLKVFKSAIPIVVTIHDMIPFKIKGKYSIPRSFYIKIFTLLSSKISNHIITVSESTKSDIVSICNVSSTKITVVYNFLNRDYTSCNVLKEDFIVSLSTIEPGKNYVKMIEGFLFFIEEFPKFRNFNYVIIGKKGWGSDSVFDVVQKSKFGYKIIFKDYVSEEEKFNLLSKAQCLLFLSKYEGFGIPILEALYSNTPSVVLNNSSLPEVVGNSGVIIDRDDAPSISAALKEIVESRMHYCSSIKDDILKFDSDNQIEKFIKVIQSFKIS